jgi:ketosteroid isomerase-like protein
MRVSREIRDIIAAWFGAVADGDARWRDDHVSTDPDLRLIGTDPEEWLSGPSAYDFFAREARAVGGKVTVRVLEVEGFEEGTVGWGSARPEITLPDGGQVTPRWSAVFHREDGSWKMVQLHASVAVGNAEAFGDVFETRNGAVPLRERRGVTNLPSKPHARTRRPRRVTRGPADRRHRAWYWPTATPASSPVGHATDSRR